MQKKFLMCQPDHFGVNYEINPWMEGQIGNVDKDKAVVQWFALFNALSKVAKISLVDSVDGLPDMVFTANAGFVQGTTAVLSRFTSHERQYEEQYFHEWFDSKHLTVVQTMTKYEGEGDHLVDSMKRHWMGSGFRSEPKAAKELEIFLHTKVNVLELVDPRWYHLDTCFCPLPHGEVMWYPGAFSEASQDVIRLAFTRSVEVTEADALLFCCNCICVDNLLFLPTGSTISEKLFSLGYSLWEGDLSEFLKAGGAAKCLVLERRL